MHVTELYNIHIIRVKLNRGGSITIPIYLTGIGITIISTIAEKVCDNYEYEMGSKVFNTTGGAAVIGLVVYEFGKLMVELNKLAKYAT